MKTADAAFQYAENLRRVLVVQPSPKEDLLVQLEGDEGTVIELNVFVLFEAAQEAAGLLAQRSADAGSFRAEVVLPRG